MTQTEVFTLDPRTLSDNGSPASERPAVVGHTSVRAALRNHARYSSDLQGDRDVRTYKQLPLEVDPPDHGLFRAVLTPIFSAERVQSLAPALRAVAAQLLDELVPASRCEVVRQLSLEMVVRCLGVVLGRPQDVDEWRSWGPDVWISTPHGRSGEHLQRYLDATFAVVAAHPGDDAFSTIDRATIDGRPLTYTEKCGLANIILAGGRDTVVTLISGFMWHLASTPADYDYLAADRSRITRAMEEMVRFLSPLPAMERVDTDVSIDPPAYTWIAFATANHDPLIFDAPEQIRLDRHPNPHMGFGGGPHACIGNLVAKAETRALLEELLDRGLRWKVLEDAEVEKLDIFNAATATRFRRLPIAFT
jgi:cytochrome P450